MDNAPTDGDGGGDSPSAARAAVDALRAPGGDAAEALRRCTALRDGLDPADPADAERILRAAGEARGRDLSWEPAVLEVLDRCADDALRRRAGIVAAQLADHRGDAAGAESRYRSLLRSLRGSGTAEERAACVNLVRLFLLGGREYEALVLSQAAERLLRTAGDAWGLANLLLHRGRVLLSLEDLPRTVEALAAADGATGAVAPPRDRLLRFSLEGLRARERLAAGDPEGCLAALARAEALAAGDPVPVDPRLPLLLRARALRAAGRSAEAAEALDAVLDMGPPADPPWFEARAEEARLAFLVEGRAAGLARVRPLLAALASLGPGRTPSGWRLHLAAGLARWLEEEANAPAETRAAHDLAAAATLERMRELGDARRDLPELDGVEAADLEILEDHRRRVLREQRALLEAVQRAMEDAARREGGLPAALLDAAGGLHSVCAWCRRLRTPDGTWVPLGQFVPDTVPVRVTHGICGVCREVVAAGG